MHPTWGTLAVTAVALSAVSHVSIRAADPVFIVSQPLAHSLSTRGGDSFQIFVSSPKQVDSPNVLVVQIKSPRGELLPPELVTIDQPTVAIDPRGTAFGVKVKDTTLFKAAGDYAVTLRVSGVVEKAVESQLLTLTLQVPAPALNLDKLQNLTIRVGRWTPWSAAKATASIRLQETGGRSNVHDLKVTAQDVFVKSTAERSGATVKIKDGTNGDDGRGKTLWAGDHRDLSLEIAGLDRAGEMTTSLTIASPSLTAAATLPLTIEVADRWPVPLLVITLGVALGACVRYLSQVARPREVARARRTLLSGDVARWRERSRDPQQVQLLDDIDDLLRRSDERLQLGDAAGATTAMDDAEKKLTEFQKTWNERFAAVLKREHETSEALDKLVQRIPPTEVADLARLDAARMELVAARQVLAIFDLPAAEARISTATAVLAALDATHPAQAAGRSLTQRRGPQLDIEVSDPPDAHIAGQTLSFNLIDPATVVAPDDEIEWDWGDGTRLTARPGPAQHQFPRQGPFRVRIVIRRAGQDVLTAVTRVEILARPIELLVVQQARGLGQINFGLTTISLVLAILTCMGLLFFGKVFGTPAQYVEAFLWGFGIDSSVKNVADLLKKV
jgi:hypothetical protein